MAIVLFASSSPWVVVSLYLSMLSVLMAGAAFHPAVRADRRTLTFGLALTATVVGVLRFDSVICQYAWWAIECWFHSATIVLWSAVALAVLGVVPTLLRDEPGFRSRV